MHRENESAAATTDKRNRVHRRLRTALLGGIRYEEPRDPGAPIPLYLVHGTLAALRAVIGLLERGGAGKWSDALARRGASVHP